MGGLAYDNLLQSIDLQKTSPTMPYPLQTDVLTIDTNVVNKFDTSNSRNICIFAESVRKGRGLKSLCWRLWNRATICCGEGGQASITATIPLKEIPQHNGLHDTPPLSGSVESENDVEAADFTPLSVPLETRPRIQRQNSWTSNRSRDEECHVTSGDLENSDTDYVDETAIDDDDASTGWEDEIEEKTNLSIGQKTFFQRVDPKVNLTSRRSLITLMIEQKHHTSKDLGNIASQSPSALPWSRTSHPALPTLAVSPNDSDDAPLMMKRGIRSSPQPINDVLWSAARPIHTTASHNHSQEVLSPRTTRRNMLATELTESLCRNLLWEHQQKSSTANAVLKRRHTSHDVANLKQYPEKVCLKDKDNQIPNSEYFSELANQGYNAKGW
ncbi:hypothetical protein CDEST_01991 [Colletotrichum destructivum]|uniref:DUF3295 domain-containing protein n=1 Tax=Colletotrichum destructivum TaxID=34406 RepID=A0AAX4I0Q4_9PEZI|nr:hypothetical protein CDEST_01991 [Colletotrichum destructivum]